MISFEVELKTLGLFLVGSASPVMIHADISFYRTRNPHDQRKAYRPVIPGSSVKGALRSSFNRVAHAFGMSVCSGWPISDNGCDACYLFGAPGKGGCVWVEDFVGEAKTLSLTHVSIDDNSGAAREGALYTYEYVLPGTVFNGRIGYDGDVKRLPALLVAMAALRTDRAGRRGLVDLRIRNADTLKSILTGLGEYSTLLEYLGGWAWDEDI